MSFREWINIEGGGHVFVFYETRDLRAAARAAAFLVEGSRTWNLDNRWSVRMDQPHAPNMLPHTHVMLRGDDVSIINRDGTQSHGTNRDQVPNWVIDRIRQMGQEYVIGRGQREPRVAPDLRHNNGCTSSGAIARFDCVYMAINLSLPLELTNFGFRFFQLRLTKLEPSGG